MTDVVGTTNAAVMNVAANKIRMNLFDSDDVTSFLS